MAGAGALDGPWPFTTAAAEAALSWARSSPVLGWMLGLVVVLALLWEAARRRSAARLDMDLIPGPWRKGSLLLGNMMDLMRADFHRTVLDWANEYGGIYRARVLWMNGLVVTDPAVVASVCGRGGEGLDKADIIYGPINQMCTPHGTAPNLLTSPMDGAWRSVRKAVAAAFSMANIRKKWPVIQSCASKMVSQLEALAVRAGGPVTVDVDQVALRVTLDVIGLAAFSHDFRTLCLESPAAVAPPNHLLRVLPRAFVEIMLRIVNPFRALVPQLAWRGKKGERAFADFQAEMRGLLRKCLARPCPPEPADVSIGAQLWRVYHEQAGHSNGHAAAHAAAPSNGAARPGHSDDDPTAGGLLPPPPTYMGLLRNQLAQLVRTCRVGSARGAPRSTGPAPGAKAHVSAERILSEIGILFVEGFETTGHTISWTLFTIATTPGVQERLEAELDAAGLIVKPGAGARPLALDDLQGLKFLSACIKEAMRMFPVVSVMSRSVGATPTRVGPFMVPAGTPVVIPLFAIHNNEHYWEAPLEFRPERWLEVPVEAYVVGTMPPLPKGPGADTPPNSSSSPSPHASPSHSGQQPGGGGKGQQGAGARASTVVTATATNAQGCSKNRIVFMPFSEGPRNCVGQTLAKIEVAAVLASLLAAFRVELAPEMGGREGVRALESTHLTLQISGSPVGLAMRLHPRSQLAAAQ